MEKNSLQLYLVTDSRWLDGRALESVVQQAILGGVTFVQLREKNVTTEEMVEIGRPVLEVCRKHGVPFVINDDVEAASILGADGVHLGQSDMGCANARAKLGESAIIGISAGSLAEACAAKAAGADYIGVGAVFPTGTKDDAGYVTHAELREICDTVDIPVVAIGGITTDNIDALKSSGIDGVAVVSAILSADDISQASAQLAKSTVQFIGQ